MGQLDDDLAFILADQVSLTGQGVVRWRGKTFNATFDDADEVVRDLAGEMVIQDGQVLRVRTADLPSGAGQGDPLTIDAVSHVARRLLKEGDGRVTLVLVAKA